MYISKFFFSDLVDFKYPTKRGIAYVELDPETELSRFIERNGKYDPLVQDFVPEKIVEESTPWERRIWLKHPTRGWGYFIAVSNTGWKRPDLSGICLTCDPRFTDKPGWDVEFKTPIFCQHNSVRLLYTEIPMKRLRHPACVNNKLSLNIRLSKDSMIPKAIELLPHIVGDTDFSEFRDDNSFVGAVLFRLVCTDKKKEKLFLTAVTPGIFLEGHHYLDKCTEALQLDPDSDLSDVLNKWINAKIFYGLSFNRKNNCRVFDQTVDDWAGGHLPTGASWIQQSKVFWSYVPSDTPALYVPTIRPDSDGLDRIDTSHVITEVWKDTDDTIRSRPLPIMKDDLYTKLKEAEHYILSNFIQV